MRADFWTKERIARLKRLWAEGKSASVIAKELSAESGSELGGVSRAAVLGKIFRLRLDRPEKPAKTSAQGPKAAGKKPLVASPNDLSARRRGPEPSAQRAPERKSIFDLTNRCCRWPHGEPGTKNFFFCGAAGADIENGLPYCPRHMRRAYIVPPNPSGMASPPTVLTPWRFVSLLRSKTAA